MSTHISSNGCSGRAFLVDGTVQCTHMEVNELRASRGNSSFVSVLNAF